LPETECIVSAFPGKAEFDDGREHLYALPVGCEGVEASYLTPPYPNVRIIGASSSYLLVDITDAMTSEQVAKRCLAK